VPYRVSSPPDREPEELEDPYVAVLRRQRRRTRVMSVAVVVLAGAGLVKVARSSEPPRDRAVRAEAARIAGAREALASARARAEGAQARFEAGVREAIAQDVGPRGDLGACPVTLPPASSIVRGRAAFPLLTVRRDELGGRLPSQAVAEVLADARRAEAHLAAGRSEEATLYARALDRPERFAYDVVLVTEADKPVRALSGTAYEPGEIAGRAYLYDFASQRVVCAGDVRAQSSREVGYMYSDRDDTPPSLGPLASMDDAIREDIRRQTEQAIRTALRFRSGPPAR
jgi:hypothetical protein